MGEFLEMFIPFMIHILEAMGVIIISVSAIIAFYKYVGNLIFKKKYSIKIELAQALILALEFKLAGEILKTVIIRTFDEMLILASIILLRAILTFVLHWEMKHDKEELKEEFK